jgi:hypothetical protein
MVSRSAAVTPASRRDGNPRIRAIVHERVKPLAGSAGAVPPGDTPRGNLTLNVDAIVLLGPGDSEYRASPLRVALQARLDVLF